MRHSFKWAAGLLVLWTMVLGPPARAEAPPRELAARLTQACAGGPTPGKCSVMSLERRKVFDDVGVDNDIYEYTYHLQVGLGQYDTIAVHRVVREDKRSAPVPTTQSVFLVHGDIWGFDGAFLSTVARSTTLTEEPFAVYLARRGVDVWGIDLRWVSVPPGVTDFGFMKDWNLGLHAQDVGLGVFFARALRLVTFSGFGQMPLLGWSRGAAIGYALLNMEAQLPADKRQINGFIPVDMALAFDPKDVSQRNASCAGYALLSKLQAQGLYEGGGLGVTLKDMGSLANTRPQDSSPYVTGFSHRQAALFAGTATYALQGVPVIQGYHFTGGSFAGPVPTKLNFTSEKAFFDTLEQASPYQSLGEQVETLALWCGAPTLPYTSHLRQVSVPVLYVGAAGGTGRYGLYSLSLLGSKDITSHYVQLLDDAARPMDFGHMDLFSAAYSPSLVWPRIADWLEHH